MASVQFDDTGLLRCSALLLPIRWMASTVSGATASRFCGLVARQLDRAEKSDRLLSEFPKFHQYECNDANQSSIVFLHGLNGDRVRTWTKDGIFWPRDLLPQKLPQCRTMTFGYNADLGLSSSTLSIRDFAVSLLSGLRDERQGRGVIQQGNIPMMSQKLLTSLQQELGRPIIFVCHSLGGIVIKKAGHHECSTLAELIKNSGSPCSSRWRQVC